MKLWLESALAITVEATNAGDESANELASIAKAYVAERCPEIIQDCVQMHGGIGVTWDHDIHLYLRRATVHRQTYGQPAEHRDRVAERVASGCGLRWLSTSNRRIWWRSEPEPERGSSRI